MALSTDLEVGEHNLPVFEFPENLARFGFNFFFLVGDVGITLSMMSRLATPGYPAPERACIVTTCTFSIPKAASSGASAKTSAIVEQLGFVMMYPLW
jgi:hypothetical protein